MRTVIKPCSHYFFMTFRWLRLSMIDKSIILNWKIKAGSIRCGHETQLCHMMKLGETSLILIMKLFVTW